MKCSKRKHSRQNKMKWKDEMKVIVKYKRWLDSCTCFCSLLTDGFFQIMCIVFFNFELNGVEAESIISKQFSLLYALQVSLLARCANMWYFLYVSRCSLILVDK